MSRARITKSYHEEDFITMKPKRFLELMEASNALALASEPKEKKKAAPKPATVSAEPLRKERRPKPEQEPKITTVPEKDAEGFETDIKPEAIEMHPENLSKTKGDEAMIGRVFGRLTVIALAASGKWGHCYLCQCRCGNQKVITRKNLISGNSKSCGCARYKKLLNATPANQYRYRKRLMEAGYIVDIKTKTAWYDENTSRSIKLELSYPGQYQFKSKKS